MCLPHKLNRSCDRDNCARFVGLNLRFLLGCICCVCSVLFKVLQFVEDLILVVCLCFPSVSGCLCFTVRELVYGNQSLRLLFDAE